MLWYESQLNLFDAANASVFWFLDAEHYVAHFTPAAPKEKADAAKHSFYMPRRQILTAKTLGDAVRGCDTYIINKIYPSSPTSL